MFNYGQLFYMRRPLYFAHFWRCVCLSYTQEYIIIVWIWTIFLDMHIKTWLFSLQLKSRNFPWCLHQGLFFSPFIWRHCSKKTWTKGRILKFFRFFKWLRLLTTASGTFEPSIVPAFGWLGLGTRREFAASPAEQQGSRVDCDPQNLTDTVLEEKTQLPPDLY